MFKNLRLKIGDAMLRKKKKRITRSKQVQNFTSAKTACIVFDGLDVTELTFIKKYREHLQSYDINVFLLGYINSDKMPSEYLLLKNSLMISKNDLDLFYRPKKEICQKFLAKKFDMLIDLSINDFMCLRYLAVLSAAFFKVGKYTEMLNDFDMMINIREDSTVQYLGEQILHYVGRLNNPLDPSSANTTPKR